MVLEAAAQTVDDLAQKEVVVTVWGKLLSQVIGEMKNGFLVEQVCRNKQSLEPPRRRVVSCNSNKTIDQLASGQSTAQLPRRRTSSVPSVIIVSDCGDGSWRLNEGLSDVGTKL